MIIHKAKPDRPQALDRLQSSRTGPPFSPPNGQLFEVAVKISMILVSVAVAIGLRVHFDLPAWQAGFFCVGGYLVAICIHILVGRQLIVISRLRGELSQLKNQLGLATRDPNSGQRIREALSASPSRKERPLSQLSAPRQKAALKHSDEALQDLKWPPSPPLLSPQVPPERHRPSKMTTRRGVSLSPRPEYPDQKLEKTIGEKEKSLSRHSDSQVSQSLLLNPSRGQKYRQTKGQSPSQERPLRDKSGSVTAQSPPTPLMQAECEQLERYEVIAAQKTSPLPCGKTGQYSAALTAQVCSEPNPPDNALGVASEKGTSSLSPKKDVGKRREHERRPAPSSSTLEERSPLLSAQKKTGAFVEHSEKATEPLQKDSRAYARLQQQAQRIRSKDSLPALPPRDEDVEMIQKLIKKLANEVNSAETQSSSQNSPDFENLAAETRKIETSALKATASSMKDLLPDPHSGRDDNRYIDPGPNKANKDPSRSTRKPLPKHHAFHEKNKQRSCVSTAVEAFPVLPVRASPGREGRKNVPAEPFKLTLAPVLEFKTLTPRHFEIKAHSGFEKSTSLSGGGPYVFPRVAAAEHMACISELAHYLTRCQLVGAVFCRIHPETAASDQFLDALDFAHQASEDFSRQLTLTFSQGDVRSLVKSQWHVLEDMRGMGFRFAICSLIDLNMDLQILRRRGFKCVKMPANVFLRGLPLNRRLVPPGEMKDLFADSGLSLVVENIRTQEDLKTLWNLGVDFGQGRFLNELQKTSIRGSGSGNAAA